jgi:PleD family two-component response regulator
LGFSLIDPGTSDRAKHILIVEDDPSLRRVLRMQLEAEGYRVSEAENGATGLSILQHESPDLVILDVMMPEMDGYTVCQKIREQRRFQQMPVIFLTAKDAAESRIMSLDNGANDYLTKPYNRHELLLRVRNHINTGRAQRDANPLTGLPGNAAIELEVRSRLDRREEFALLYLDLDNFKAYNDTYSYRAGDRVIQLTAQLLNNVFTTYGQPGDFIGHIGGDDFVAITSLDKADAVCEAFVQSFDRAVLDHYGPEDRARGYVEVENRRFQMERFPLVSVTIALVETDRYHIDHIAMLNDVVSDLKKRGKRIPGSVVVRDQRTSAPPVPRTGSDG